VDRGWPIWPPDSPSASVPSAKSIDRMENRGWVTRRPTSAADRFFERDQELNPSPPGWTDRMPVLHLRELLSVIAAYGPTATTHINQTQGILAPTGWRSNAPVP
jgi:hypothetical protein